MAVQYSPLPEFQVPNVNLLGAYAQGVALRQNELQQERLQQQMDLAQRAAGFTANREAREASKFQMEENVKLQELKQKILEHAQRQLQSVPVGDDAGYQAVIAQYKEMLPDEYNIASKYKWDDQTRRMMLLTPEQQYKQATKDVTLPTGETQTMRYNEFGGGAAAPIGGLKSAAKPEYKEIGGELYGVTPQGATAVPLLPAGRGQAGAFSGEDMTTSLIKEREGFQPTGKWDVNANRAGYGSDTVTLPDGSVQKITKGMRVSEEDAARDLQRRIQTEFVPKAAAKVGEDVWAQLPENVRAPLTSIAYNYGTIPSRIVPAVRSGNPETIARAIESLAGDNKGINAGRRMQEANMARGTSMPGSAAVPAFAAAGSPEFMGGPQIQPPINMMNAMSPPSVNAMAAPAMEAPAAPAPVEQPLTIGGKTLSKAQTNVDATLDKMLSKYNRLDQLEAIPSSKRGFMSNLESYAASTSLGQEVEKVRATPAQTERNELKSLRRALLKDIMAATGMSAKELDSNFELKSMLESLSDETMDIDSARRIVADLSARYGKGKIAMPKETPIAAPAATAPAAPVAANRPPLSSFWAR